MKREEIKNLVIDAIAGAAEVDKAEIVEDASIMDDLSLSSMEIMIVMSELETKCSMTFGADSKTCVTVGDMIDYIESKQQ